MSQRRAAPTFVLLVLASGCSLEAGNRTPAEFPWTATGLPPTAVLLHPSSTPERLLEMMRDPAHRFALEIKRRNVTDISAFITVNGTEHPMAPYNGSWVSVFESPDECQASYSYHYRVRYKRGSLGWATKTVGSQTSPFVTNVVGHGTVIWWHVGRKPQSGNGDVNLEAGVAEAIHVQNLSPGRVRIDLLGFDASDPDTAYFKIEERPPLPVVMSCGESMNFRLRYSSPDQRTLVMTIGTSFDIGGTWRPQPPTILTLRGSSPF